MAGLPCVASLLSQGSSELLDAQHNEEESLFEQIEKSKKEDETKRDGTKNHGAKNHGAKKAASHGRTNP